MRVRGVEKRYRFSFLNIVREIMSSREVAAPRTHKSIYNHQDEDREEAQYSLIIRVTT